MLRTLLTIMIVFAPALPTVIAEVPAEPAVTIDAGRVIEPLQHRAAGALYGFSNRTPDDKHLAPIRPRFLRMASGRNAELVHGDFSNNPYCVFDMYDRAVRLGVQRIEVMCNLYAPKTWATWDIQNPDQSLQEWLDRLERIASLKVERGYDLVYYDLFNEPDINGSPDKLESSQGRKGQKDGFTALGKGDFDVGFYRAWQESYRRVKSVDREAKIVGPSLANASHIEAFLGFCRDRDCLPDVLSIHCLSGYGGVTDVVAKLRQQMTQLAIDPLPISINEYASARELGRPHPCCMYLCQIEREEIETGIAAYWFAPGTFGSILNAYGQVRPGWWLYRWYGQMRGDVLASRRSAAQANALACINRDRSEVSILFAADEQKLGPSAVIRLTGTEHVPFLNQTNQCRITLSRTPYGVDQQPVLVYCRNVAVREPMDVVVPYLSNEAAFRIVIGPALDAPEVDALATDQQVDAQSPVDESPSQQGLMASVHSGVFVEFPDFTTLQKPAREHVETFSIRREKQRNRWHRPKIVGRFAVAFDGYVDVPAKSLYTFYLQSLEGSRLYINGQLIVDNATTHKLGPDQGQVQYNKELPEAHGQIALEPGFHRIRVEYVVQGAGELKVYYSSPSMPKRRIPNQALRH